MTAVSIKEAKAKLSELIHKLKPGDEVIITDKNVPVTRLLSAARPAAQRRLGSLRGTVKYMAPDFDAPFDEFKEHMESMLTLSSGRRTTHRNLAHRL